MISSGTDFGNFMDKFITCTKRSCDDDVSSNPTPKKFKHEITTLAISGLEQQKHNLSKHISVSNRCLEASYETPIGVSKRVVKVGKPHTIAEAL